MAELDGPKSYQEVLEAIMDDADAALEAGDLSTGRDLHALVKRHRKGSPLMECLNAEHARLTARMVRLDEAIRALSRIAAQGSLERLRRN